MLIGITGTPGTGKTTVSGILSTSFGYRIINLNDLIKEKELHCGVDTKRDCLIADIEHIHDSLIELIDENTKCGETVLVESHMSHYITDTVIVLRASPDILKKRLQTRNYSPEKIEENVEAEALDVILAESVQYCKSVFEVNTTYMRPEEIAEYINHIIKAIKNGKEDDLDGFRPGNIDWSEDFFK
ncbi:Adenylate kinase [Methanosalsum zhilinae DSM 4017]|uniref:Putative adenylate kinase n=1 Tax=Methanosalsum zhilinae (strain DSM 4017 / NBRC 107636 / OCM 62 / WeN5) TaxID=679901 RepID=F7XN95_METZD|nr:adenylate kinase family protein [Methanosalsum zhilinae]AEH60053.1 Adenylate kinase [Methanosalsum zhilinae DSM 4017]